MLCKQHYFSAIINDESCPLFHAHVNTVKKCFALLPLTQKLSGMNIFLWSVDFLSSELKGKYWTSAMTTSACISSDFSHSVLCNAMHLIQNDFIDCEVHIVITKIWVHYYNIVTSCLPQWSSGYSVCHWTQHIVS